MANVVVVGAQWGDEGKGKIIDILAKDVDYVVRYFVWNYLWTFSDRKAVGLLPVAGNLLRFNLSSGLTAMLVNWGILVALKELLGFHEEIANFIGIVAGTASNYLISHRWAFRHRTPENQKTAG